MWIRFQGLDFAHIALNASPGAETQIERNISNMAFLLCQNKRSAGSPVVPSKANTDTFVPIMLVSALHIIPAGVRAHSALLDSQRLIHIQFEKNKQRPQASKVLSEIIHHSKHDTLIWFCQSLGVTVARLS